MEDTAETEVLPSVALLRAAEVAPTESISRADLDEALLELTEPVATLAPIERASAPAPSRPDRTKQMLVALGLTALVGAVMTGLLVALVALSLGSG